MLLWCAGLREDAGNEGRPARSLIYIKPEDRLDVLVDRLFANEVSLAPCVTCDPHGMSHLSACMSCWMYLNHKVSSAPNGHKNSASTYNAFALCKVLLMLRWFIDAQMWYCSDSLPVAQAYITYAFCMVCKDCHQNCEMLLANCPDLCCCVHHDVLRAVELLCRSFRGSPQFLCCNILNH